MLKSERKRFLIAGAINVLIGNLFLQGLLIFLPIGVSTLSSQVFSSLLGYFLYGKLVFTKSVINKRSLGLFTCLSAILWAVNWTGIGAGIKLGLGKSISAILMIPILASISYVIQKYIIYKRPY